MSDRHDDRSSYASETLADIWLRGDSRRWDAAQQTGRTGSVWLLTRWENDERCRARLVKAEHSMNNRVRMEFEELG